MSKGRAWRALALAAVLVVVSAESAGAAEFYYAIIFGSQSAPKQLRYTHTWGTFIKAVGEGPDLRSYALDVRTISWLPQTLNIRVWSPHPEPGVNLDLPTTLDVVLRQGQSVTMWGPFFIGKEFYDRAIQSTQLLDQGAVLYRAIDGQWDLEVADCIHAVTSVDPLFGRAHYPLIRIGKPASRYIARRIVVNGGIDQSLYDNSWLIPRLGLDRYPIEVVPPLRIPRRYCLFCVCPE